MTNNGNSMMRQQLSKGSLLIVVLALTFIHSDIIWPATAAPPATTGDQQQEQQPTRPATLIKRSTEAPKHDPKEHHTSMVHNHLSRKVFDRACAASKDTIDEIVACFTSNEHLVKNISPALAAGCYSEAFGGKFDPKDMKTHKEMICKNREKFEDMTACIYRKTTETLGPKEVESLVEAMVDVGLCIINALD